MYAIISPFSQSFDDIGFTYKIPESLIGEIQAGMIVLIPFGKKTIFGVILNISDETNFDKNKIKDITDMYSKDIFLNNISLQMISWIAKYYFCGIHHALNLFIPRHMVGQIEKKKFIFEKKAGERKYTFDYKKKLLPQQQDIIQDIIHSNKKKFLLHGVTGSGKTEIYIHIIHHYLQQGKQSLLLVPEILLTSQIFERIIKVFGKEVIILNSTVSSAKKTSYWKDIYFGDAKIIIGTRSSLFYPYQDLGVILIDEEHDNSYISDVVPRYHTGECASFLADISNTKVIFGSGTPNINHYFFAKKSSDYTVFSLLEEFSQ